MSLFDDMNKNKVAAPPSQGGYGQSQSQAAQWDSMDESMPAVDSSKLIRNTYTLLSMTLLFSALTAGIAMATNMPPIHWAITLIGYFGLLFATQALSNSGWGLLMVFALTGFMGLTLGPMLSAYMTVFKNGSQLIMMAFGTTSIIFLGLSGYALVSRKDFNFLGQFIFIGVLVAFVAGLANIFFQIPALSLAVSSMFVLLMSGYILYQTSELVHGRETNYIMATVGLYVSIYNLFISLLQLFGAFFGED